MRDEARVMAMIPDSFKHEPLSNAAGQIRLLRVSSLTRTRDDQEQINCELITCEIGDEPSYIAVSYTWGDTANSKAIFVNGRTLTIRHNCWFVLWQASANDTSQLIWIDALCINQSDDIEKSSQVAMMGDIYRNAKQVNVCLGPHGGDSQILFHAVKEHAIFVENELRGYAKSGAFKATIESLQRKDRVEQGLTETAGVMNMRRFTQSVRAIFLRDMATSDRFNSISREDLAALSEARFCLTDRAYFSRLWICQEILLGHHVMLMVGNASVNFEDFLDFESDLVHFCIGKKDAPDSAASHEFNSIVNIRYGWSSTGMGLLELTDIFSRFQCFDVRDRIFGMLGMVDWQGYPPMVPDYKKTAFEVGIDAISYMCPPPGTDNPARDNMNWPVASAIQIVSALGLDVEDSDVKTRLHARRSQPKDSKVPNDTNYTTLARANRYVEVLADFYCEIFAHESTHSAEMHACLIDREDAADETFSRFVLDSERPASCLIYNRDSPRIIVPNTIRSGDVILSFRSNSTDIGVIVRRDFESSEIYNVVGQAVIHEATLPCPGEEKCSCGFSRMPHQVPNTKIKVHFELEDLLLFACQDMFKAMDVESETDPVQRRYAKIHAGEMYQVAAYVKLRFATSVVKPEDPGSSYAEMIQSVKRPAGNTELEAELRALELHLNSWKTKFEA